MGVMGSIARQGRKAAMLAKKATPGQEQIEQATKGQRAYAKGQAKAAGATAGAAGLGLAADLYLGFDLDSAAGLRAFFWLAHNCSAFHRRLGFVLGPPCTLERHFGIPFASCTHFRCCEMPGALQIRL